MVLCATVGHERHNTRSLGALEVKSLPWLVVEVVITTMVGSGSGQKLIYSWYSGTSLPAYTP